MSTDNFIKYSAIYEGITNSPAASDPRVRTIIQTYDERIRKIFVSVFDTALVCPGDDLEFADLEREVQNLLEEILGKLDGVISMQKEEVTATNPDTHLLDQLKKPLWQDLRTDYERCITVLGSLWLPGKGLLLTEHPTVDDQQPLFYSPNQYQTEWLKDKRFGHPTWGEIWASLTKKDIAAYKKMKDMGLEPMLQLTPLSLTPATMSGMYKKAITDFHGGLVPDTFSPHLKKNLGPVSIQYLHGGSTILTEVSSTGKSSLLETNACLDRYDLINLYKGWLVEFVATRPSLVDYTAGTSGLRAHELLTKTPFSPNNFMEGTGMYWESYLMAQIIAAATFDRGFLDLNEKNIEGGLGSILGGHLIDGAKKQILVGRGHRIETIDRNAIFLQLCCRPSHKIHITPVANKQSA